MRKVMVLAGLLLFFGAGLGLAETTSRMTGDITDNEGVALPGVTVTARSDKLIGGPQTAITDAGGGFQFNLLPPGVYKVNADLSGFQPVELEARVSLGRTTSVKIQMVMSQFADEIEVVAEAPIVDTSQVDSGQVFDESFLQLAAVGSGGRDYLQIIGQAAGVAGSGNVNVYGSTDSENAYLIDGLNTTDPVTGTFGTNFNYDAIQEVNFMTGGFEAEFGQATGGIVNLVTKSGGNEFSGTLDARYTDNGFYESGDHYDPDERKNEQQSISATLGGPVMRDRLWFFVSGEDVDNKFYPAPVEYTDIEPRVWNYTGQNYIGKLTWQASDNNRAIFKVSGDPAEITNTEYSVYVEPEADGRQEQGGDIFQVELSSVLSNSVLLTAQAGLNKQELTVSPMSGDLETPGIYNYTFGTNEQNYNNYQSSDRDRLQMRGNMSYFVDGFGGSHELKGGLEYNDLKFDSVNYYTGGVYLGQIDGVEGYADLDGDGYTDYLGYFDFPFDTARDPVRSTGTIWTLFVQDAWRPLPNLTVKPGLRFETVSFDNVVGQTVADLNRVQPRLGLAWDLRNDGKSVVRASWGRFMHPTALTIPNFISGRPQGTALYVGLEYFCTFGYCDPDSPYPGWPWLGQPVGGAPGTYTTTDDAGNEHLWWLYSNSGGDLHYTIDTLGVGNLEAPYADELIVAFEQEIFSNTSIEVSYVDKKTRSLIEDTCINNSWAWGDGAYPSYDDPSTWTAENECTSYVVANIPGLYRDYKGYILKVESRARDWFHILGSYARSESKGNTAASAGQAYASGLYDRFPIDYYNIDGFMSDHRRNRVKLSGYFLLPWDFTIGLDSYWSSAGVRTISADCEDVLGASQDELDALGINQLTLDICEAYSLDSINLTPRGQERGKTNYQIDLQVSKGFKIGGVNLETIAAIQNLLSDEQVTGQYDTAFRPTPLSSPTSWQTPRRYEVGLRLEF